jgi:ABC-type lipoprotein release transport system permease subunit
MMLNGQVTELLIREKGAADSRIPGISEAPDAIAVALSARVIKLPPELGLYSWKDYAQDYIAASAADDISTRIMTVILFILSFLGIANTMLLAILERTKEIGMMRAQGMTDGQLVFTMMAEASLIGFFGALLGILLGCLANIPMVNYGIDFSAMAKSMGGDIGYRISSSFRSSWNVPVIIGSGIVAMAVSACMAYLPTRRALKMPVTESLRFE